MRACSFSHTNTGWTLVDHPPSLHRPNCRPSAPLPHLFSIPHFHISPPILILLRNRIFMILSKKMVLVFTDLPTIFSSVKQPQTHDPLSVVPLPSDVPPDGYNNTNGFLYFFIFYFLFFLFLGLLWNEEDKKRWKRWFWKSLGGESGLVTHWR